MSKRNCCVYGCDNTHQNTKDLTPKVHFYKFSTKEWQKERMKKWIIFAKRKNIDGTPWEPTKNSHICSHHFVNNNKSEDPRNPSYNPTIHPMEKIKDPEIRVQRYKRLVKRREVQKEVAPTVEEYTVQIENAIHDDIVQQHEVECQTDDSSEFDSMQIFMSTTSNGVACTQVTHNLKKHTTNASTGGSNRSPIFCGYETIRSDEKRLKSLTSVTMNVFSLLLSLLPNAQPVKNGLSRENRLLLFLMKLKTNLSFVALSTLFDISPTTASTTFSSILYNIYDRTINWILWPSREANQLTMPDAFKLNYPSCRVIIDCTEIKSEMPPSVETQVQMYSDYKCGYTAKFLIGISPSGQIIFVSKGYGGRSSDTYITKECGILDKLEPGDLVMADKGFPNLTMVENTVLVMPPFSRAGQSQFTESQMKLTYDVASVRIHVERSIGRLKIFNILTHRVKIDLLPYMDEILHVCSVLVNLQPPIIKPK